MQATTEIPVESGMPIQEIEAAPGWHFMKRLAFRFACAYFILYTFPFPFDLLPFTTWLTQKYDDLWHVIVPWVGKHGLRLSYDITVFTNGSGDTTYDYVKVLCLLILAVVATTIWSLLDRNRAHYERLHEWSRILIRFSLASAMISYGAAKVIPLQMPAPFFTRLLEPYGDSSPMGLLWTFIGASKGFQIFTGCAEMLGGVLLILRRTTLIGALVCLADTTLIFTLNLCYDVPVKLYSFHLLMMSVFLMAPDADRLARLFFLNRRVEPVTFPRLFQRQWLNRGVLVLQILFGFYLIGSSLYESYQQAKVYGEHRPKPPLYGIWVVDEFSLDGQVRPPLVTDTSRWQRAIFQFPEVLVVQPMSGPNQNFRLNLDLENRTLVLGKRDKEDWKAEFILEELDAKLISLRGEIDGQKLYAKLSRFDESTFLLKSRGFHWIQEYPFNR